MIRFGYRATVCVGAGFVMIAVIVLSYLAAGAEGGVKFFLYGPAGEFNSNNTKHVTEESKTTIIVKLFSFSFVNKHLRDVLNCRNKNN
jgi:hypothetical protein